MFRLCDRIGLGPSLLYRRPRAHDGREWSIRADRATEPVSIFGSFFLDDTFGSSLSLTMPSTLAPIRIDASVPRGTDIRLATEGYIVRGLLDDSLPRRLTS